MNSNVHMKYLFQFDTVHKNGNGQYWYKLSLFYYYPVTVRIKKKACVVQVLQNNFYFMQNQIFEILFRKYPKSFGKPQSNAYHNSFSSSFVCIKYPLYHALYIHVHRCMLIVQVKYVYNFEMAFTFICINKHSLDN